MEARLAIFDLAGTTVKDNQDVHRALQQAMAEFNFHIALDDANEVMGIPKPVAIQQLLFKYGHLAPDASLIEAIHLRFVQVMIDFYKTDSGVGEKEGVSDVFRKLKNSGIKVVVDTGFDRAITNTLLTRLKWEVNNLIDGSVTSDEVKHGRPHPDLIFKAMEIMGVIDAATVLKVGDTVSDLEEGTSAGCGRVVGITWGAHSRKQLMTAPHTHLIDHISQVVSIIDLH